MNIVRLDRSFRLDRAVCDNCQRKHLWITPRPEWHRTWAIDKKVSPQVPRSAVSLATLI